MREIAEETLDLAEIEESLVQGLQKYVEPDEPDEIEMDLLESSEDSAEEIAVNVAATGASPDGPKRPAFDDNIGEDDEF